MPTVVFSGALVFVLTWWLAGFIIGGAHGHSHDAHPHHGPHHAHHGDHHGRHGDHHGHDGEAAGGHGHAGSIRSSISDLPQSMTWLVLVFGAWATSILLTVLGRALGADGWSFPLRVVTGTVIAALALVVGVAVLAAFAGAAAPIFEDHSHPGKSSAVGATCRVRIPPNGARLGDAYVLTGPTKASIVRIEAASDAESLAKGDVVLIVDFDPDRDAFLVTEIDPSLAPGPAERRSPSP